jgi:hypothetical protein
MKPNHLAASLGFAAVVLLAPSTASAVEKQHHLGLGGGPSFLVIDDKSTVSIGGGLALHYAYGLNDTFNLMVEGSSSIVAANQDQDTPDTPRTRPGGVDHGAFGVGYVIDVLQWIPYVCALGGVYRLHGGTLDHDLFLPGVSVGAGLDYQLSRSFAIGVAGREHFMLSKLGTYPSYTTVLLRGEYMWGW